MNDRERHERQRRLREIGSAGQARLSAAHVTLKGDEGTLVAFAYLIRAGVESVAHSRLEHANESPHAALFRFQAARRYGAGAWQALCAIRKTLGMLP